MGDFSVLAIRIKELRTKMGKTQKEFSQYVGCTAATLSAYENGSKSPSLEIIKNIAERTDVSIDWLCGLSDKESPHQECKTYSDVIEMLFTIAEHLDITINEDFIEGEFPNPDGITYIEQRTYYSISFNNIASYNFFSDWKKMMDLHNRGSIDEEVYSLWKEKTLNKYKNATLVGNWPDDTK